MDLLILFATDVTFQSMINTFALGIEGLGNLRLIIEILKIFRWE